MKIQNLQNELSKRKLQMGEYFRITFDVLKVFAKENKLWTIFFLVANIFLLFFNSIVIRAISNDNFLVLIIMFLIVVYIGLFYAVLIAKVAQRIENTKEYDLKNIVTKYLIIFGICTAILAIFFRILIVLGWANFILMWMIGSGGGISDTAAITILLVIKGILIIPLTLLILFLLSKVAYFIQAYYIRNMSFSKAFQYNLQISKNNKLRILTPVIILAILDFIVKIPFLSDLFGILNYFLLMPFTIFSLEIFELPLFVAFPLSVIFGIISSFLLIFMITIAVIVFLNVEYNYLKKQDKNLQ